MNKKCWNCNNNSEKGSTCKNCRLLCGDLSEKLKSESFNKTMTNEDQEMLLRFLKHSFINFGGTEDQWNEIQSRSKL
jgi:hypothetical protein